MEDENPKRAQGVVLSEAEDKMEELRRFFYDFTHGRAGWRDKEEARTSCSKLDDLIEELP
jgi:hypothetical protein